MVFWQTPSTSYTFFKTSRKFRPTWRWAADCWDVSDACWQYTPCRSSNAEPGWVCHSSCWVCSCGRPIIWPPPLPAAVWTLRRHWSSRWAGHCLDPTEAAARTATGWLSCPCPSLFADLGETLPNGILLALTDWPTRHGIFRQISRQRLKSKSKCDYIN